MCSSSERYFLLMVAGGSKNPAPHLIGIYKTRASAIRSAKKFPSIFRDNAYTIQEVELGQFSGKFWMSWYTNS